MCELLLSIGSSIPPSVYIFHQIQSPPVPAPDTLLVSNSQNTDEDPNINSCFVHLYCAHTPSFSVYYHS